MTDSLRRDEAQRRAALLDVHAYDIELDLTTGDERFDSRTTIRFACLEPGASTFLDVAAVGLRSVTLNGTVLDVGGHEGRRLQLDDLAADNVVIVDAVMAYSHDGDGLHRAVDPVDGAVYLYAMSFLDAAPRWFACVDQPDLKAPVSLSVRCPDGWTVAGNGPASQDEDGVWRLASAGPLATYFTTLIAGPWHTVRGEHDGIALALHARASMAQHLNRDAAELLAHTAACFDALHGLFGTRYPWGEYHQAFVPDFNAGAMENPGCVTISESLLHRGRATAADRVERAIVVAHEMAHMWFGDLVTMRWWDDLWLNESFAEYLGQRVCGDDAWVAFAARRKSWGYAADRRPSTHPVAGNDATDAAAALTAFDGISYAKGASVLRQLAVHLGDELFLRGLRDYVTAHAYGNATFGDLAAAWTAAGAAGLDEWLASWLRTTGVDELGVVDGAVVRRGSRPHTVTAEAWAADGSSLMLRPVTVDADRVRCPVPSGAVLALPDAYDDTWAKVLVDDWAALPGLLPRIADPRSRTVIWNALQLAVADAELDPSAALDVVCAALPLEDDAVVAPVGGWARRVLAPAADGARYHRAWVAALQAAEPGSDRQLAAAREVVASATEAALPESWLEDRAVPEGLVVDRDLRWAALLQLCRLGAADDADISAEAAEDLGIQGAVNAARCRAALPTVEAKSAAWAAIIGDADRSNGELYALAEGFWVPSQRALTDPWVARYAAEIPGTARLRAGSVVRRLAKLAFPWTAVSRDALGLLAGMLDGELDTPVRRAVVDAVDDLRRAVELRERYPAT